MRLLINVEILHCLKELVMESFINFPVYGENYMLKFCREIYRISLRTGLTVAICTFNVTLR